MLPSRLRLVCRMAVVHWDEWNYDEYPDYEWNYNDIPIYQTAKIEENKFGTGKGRVFDKIRFLNIHVPDILISA